MLPHLFCLRRTQYCCDSPELHLSFFFFFKFIFLCSLLSGVHLVCPLFNFPLGSAVCPDSTICPDEIHLSGLMNLSSLGLAQPHLMPRPDYVRFFASGSVRWIRWNNKSEKKIQLWRYSKLKERPWPATDLFAKKTICSFMDNVMQFKGPMCNRYRHLKVRKHTANSVHVNPLNWFRMTL